MHRIRRSRTVAWLLLFGLAFTGFGADPEPAAAPSANSTNQAPSEAQQAWRSYLELQDQLRSAMLAIDQARKDAEEAARRSAEALAERLKALEAAVTSQRILEQAYASQRERDLNAMLSTNRSLLIVAGVLAVVSMLAMFCTVWFQMRALNRLAEISTIHRDTMLLSHPPYAALPQAEHFHPPLASVEPSSKRLLGLVEQMEKRLQELEHATQPGVSALKHAGKSNGEPVEPPMPASTDTGTALPPTGEDRIHTLLGKGQSLLNLGQVEQAIACFDQAIRLNPDHVDALLKKGHALERLQKYQEALDCYDRAIAVDESLTLAYVYKGGVYNHLERYDEALACYEKALRAQQKQELPLPAAAPA